MTSKSLPLATIPILGQTPNFVPTIHPWNQRLWQTLTSAPARTNHALLLTGNQGLGKVDLAFALAHFVLTDNHPQSETLFNGASHPDLHVIMPEDEVLKLDQSSNNPQTKQTNRLLATYARRYSEAHAGKPKRTINIDQVRKLGQALVTHPHISAHRVVLVAYAESMNRNAANALLKNLEEPPANTLFIVVSDEISKLVKTVRSRCSLVNFRAPKASDAQAWLEQHGELPSQEIANYLAMANNHPLLALRLYQAGYVGSLKTVFTDVNGLWNRTLEPIKVAKNWQEIGGLLCVEILQKLTLDLLRYSLSETPQTLFYPVQKKWVNSVSSKLSRHRLLDVVDALSYAKRLLATSVDELLVLETVSNKFRNLPARRQNT